MKRTFTVDYIFLLLFSLTQLMGQNIPLPEHPRPDFQRAEWQNLNGAWEFQFDSDNTGIQKKWSEGSSQFSSKINVPFPWGSELSGVEDEADIAWYQREIRIVEKWRDKRTFITIGASDWETTVWLDGHLLGSHQGGYVPFSFDLTEYVKYGENQKLVIRVDDKRREFTLYGKQGYGNARGIWQTVYLEARGRAYIDAVHFSPDIDNETVLVTTYLSEECKDQGLVEISIKSEKGFITHIDTFQTGSSKLTFNMDIENTRLWSLEDPYLYEVDVKVKDDKVTSYFGMRKISVMDLPGTDFPYIALNNKPIYLQLALDQSYHPEGYYTFPSDQFIKEEIMRSKSIGLNGIRTHIKVEVPRKLYWADKMGLLVMEDLPNSWGEPDEKMQKESEYTLREMIKRDYNHPSIFSWIIFNETWGLRTKNDQGQNEYLPKTQNWVASMYYLAKYLDMTRLVEDNSICCGAGHTETDINSWHEYLPGYKWEEHLRSLTKKTYEGSEFHFEKGFKQGRQPNINSECGNVWGYDGSTGDVDWSWDYHRMMNTFRKYPKVAGWLYTEHHDVINEWNGYWRFDRTVKETGMNEIVSGMNLNDLHAVVYLSTGMDISREVQGGESVEVPLFLSVMTDEEFGDNLKIEYTLSVTNPLGEVVISDQGNRVVDYQAYMQKQLEPLKINIPDIKGVGLLSFKVVDKSSNVLSQNFMYFIIDSDKSIEGKEVVSIAANDLTNEKWSKKKWAVLDGKKVNGAGSGFFEYTIVLPERLKTKDVKDSYFIAELSAKELFVKDQQDYQKDQDFMKGSKVANSSNPNSYPMTDQTLFSSNVEISINGEKGCRTVLSDDPADHRGVLSWHYQLENGILNEAGSYGYLVKVPISKKTIRKALRSDRKIKIIMESTNDGGIAVYGRQFGRYMLDPSIVIVK